MHNNNLTTGDAAELEKLKALLGEAVIDRGMENLEASEASIRSIEVMAAAAIEVGVASGRLSPDTWACEAEFDPATRVMAVIPVLRGKRIPWSDG